jgi:hypothetical protein
MKQYTTTNSGKRQRTRPEYKTIKYRGKIVRVACHSTGMALVRRMQGRITGKLPNAVWRILFKRKEIFDPFLGF